MTLEDSIQGFRLRVLTDATRSGNVTATCARFGVSRTWFYRLRARLERYGPDGLHPKRRLARRGRPSLVSVVVERQVVAKALAWPTRGPQWVSDQLACDGVWVAPVTAWRVLRRHGLNTASARLAVLEQHSAATRGILTERTRRRRQPVRHVQASRPGELVSMDSFYVGKLKGVGKVWQLTACDCASSFGWARLLIGEVTAGAMASFLRAARLSASGVAAAARAHGPGEGIQGRLYRDLCTGRADAHADEAPSCLDQWIRRTAARHHPA